MFFSRWIIIAITINIFALDTSCAFKACISVGKYLYESENRNEKCCIDGICDDDHSNPMKTASLISSLSRSKRALRNNAAEHFFSDLNSQHQVRAKCGSNCFPSHFPACGALTNLSTPVFGISASSGDRVKVLQLPPALHQTVAVSKCTLDKDDHIMAHCKQVYLPRLLYVMHKGKKNNASLFGLDYIYVESGCLAQIQLTTDSSTKLEEFENKYTYGARGRHIGNEDVLTMSPSEKETTNVAPKEEKAEEPFEQNPSVWETIPEAKPNEESKNEELLPVDVQTNNQDSAAKEIPLDQNQFDDSIDDTVSHARNSNNNKKEDSMESSVEDSGASKSTQVDEGEKNLKTEGKESTSWENLRDLHVGNLENPQNDGDDLEVSESKVSSVNVVHPNLSTNQNLIDISEHPLIQEEKYENSVIEHGLESLKKRRTGLLSFEEADKFSLSEMSQSDEPKTNEPLFLAQKISKKKKPLTNKYDPVKDLAKVKSSHHEIV